MLEFSQFVESKFKIKEDYDEIMQPTFSQQTNIQKVRDQIIRHNKMSHTFTPKTPGKPSHLNDIEMKYDLPIEED